MSRLLADRAYRVSQIREWLASEPAYGGLTAEDIETLANDPPLPLLHLVRGDAADRTAEGLHLGPLGSIIVAEVIFGALARATSFRPGTARLRLPKRSPRLSAEYYPSKRL